MAAARERWRAPTLALPILLPCLATLSRMPTMQQTTNKGACMAPKLSKEKGKGEKEMSRGES